jgi:hypothetical protein
MAERMNGHWNLKDLLGDLMGATAELAPKPRAEIWASDLGKPYVDRWLQMKGMPYSNPADGRDLMAFFLGKQIELGFVQMLTRCGVAYQAQERLVVQEGNCLPVVGKPDLVVEVRDWTEVAERLAEANDSDPYGTPAQRQALGWLLEAWRERCPQGLPPTVFEVKSINSMAFKYHHGKDGLSNAYPHHRLQLYTYLRGLGLPEGHLLYVGRDTGWIEEVVVRETEELEAAWLQDVRTMTYYYASDERPPLEPKTVEGRENWRVRYSRYRDHLYQAQEVPHGAFSI